MTAQAVAGAAAKVHDDQIKEFRRVNEDMRHQLDRDIQRLQMLRRKTQIARRGQQ